ncbi:Carboxypeptidase C [Nostoc flagelliforme CCNUN1]|uniref:Carboxypeptidase C n=1 Tax=Nostoc flagelliforme CCNUN1 TaxID=2038116 RepID=A0A2K8SU79_9NOSO|nr:Carboxypeptidase C [Nostoc flagelliforme CCNUN1]
MDNSGDRRSKNKFGKLVKLDTSILLGSIHFWKKHNFGTPKTLLYSSSKKVDPPKVDAPSC